MKLGLVSDIHCNIGGLNAALDAMGPVDRVICLGDAIYDYRFSNEVVTLLRELDAVMVQGNHEHGFFGPQGARARSQPWIDASLRDWLAERPQRVELTLQGKTLLLVHSTPWSPPGTYIYSGDPRLQRFGETGADYVLYGHTHVRLAERVGSTLVVNPGSAGEARRHRDMLALSCGVIDLASGDVSFFDYPNPTALP